MIKSPQIFLCINPIYSNVNRKRPDEDPFEVFFIKDAIQSGILTQDAMQSFEN